MAGYPCAVASLQAKGGDDAYEVTRDLLQEQLRDDDLVTLLPNDTFLLFLGQGGEEEADQFITRLVGIAKGRIAAQVKRFDYAIAAYPRDGQEGDTLIHVTSSKLQDEPRHAKL
jgi:GGDEF domain-containing protein